MLMADIVSLRAHHWIEVEEEEIWARSLRNADSFSTTAVGVVKVRVWFE
jgi:hypothetical protein